MPPAYQDRPFSNLNIGNVTIGLLAAIVVMYFVGGFMGSNSMRLALYPPAVVKDGWVWMLLTHGFLHGSFGHLLSNAITLFFFGTIAERYFGPRRYLAMVATAIVAGGLMYILLDSLLVRGLSDVAMGFSAAGFAILMACVFIAPDATVLLFFVIPLKMRTFAWVLIGLEFLTAATGNWLVPAAHLAGAGVGYAFLRWTRRTGGGGGRGFFRKRGARVLNMGHPGRHTTASDLYDDPHWKLDQ